MSTCPCRMRASPLTRPLRQIPVQRKAVVAQLEIDGNCGQATLKTISKKHRLRRARLDVRGQGGNLRYFNGFHKSILSFPIHNSLVAVKLACLKPEGLRGFHFSEE